MIEAKTREKSALYPSYSLAICLEFVRLVDSLGGKSASYRSVADKLGLASVTTRSFLGKISSSKQFGLITTASEVIQLTDAARQYLYPTDETEIKPLLISLFSKPPLYGKLVERFQDKALPPKVQLSNLLMNEYSIIKQVKDNAAECFLNSAESLGLIQNGILVLEELEPATEQARPENIVETEPETLSQAEQSPQEPARQAPASPTAGYRFEIPTLSKLSAVVFIPEGVTSKDLDYINLYMEKMLPVFLANLKDELQE